MRLTHLSVDGLKNLRDIDLKVPQLWALSGPNGSGKTALQQAIRLAILGYDPEKGRTLSATRELASDDRGVQVGLTFDTGFGVRRILGKSTETEVAPPDGETTEREKQARIAEETGAFPLSFDLGAFLDLSAEKRRDFLFELLPRGAADLDEETFRSWLGYDEADDVIRKGIDHLWQTHVLAAQSPLDGLATAIEAAHAKMLEAERARQTAATISADADRDAEEASEAVADFDEEQLSRLQAEAASVEQRLGELREATESAERERRRHAHQVSVAKIRHEEAADEVGSIRLLLEQVQELDAPTVEAAAERVVAAREALQAADQKPAEDLERIRALAKAVEEARAVREKDPDGVGQLEGELGATRRAAHQLRDRIQSLTGVDTCPVCGNEADIDHVRAELEAELAEVEARAGELATAIEGRREESRALAKREAAAAAELQQARQDVEDGGVERRREAQAEMDAATRALNELRSAAERRRSLMGQLDTAETRLERAAAELEELQDQAPGEAADTSSEQDRLLDRASDLRQRMADLQEAARAFGKAEALREQADRKRREMETATYRAEAFKQLHSGLQKLRAHAIESMVGPVEKRAAELLAAIDPAKRFAFRFEREGRPVLDFGFEEDDVYRSYDAASTGEDAFLAVVLVAATVAAVQPAWPVLMIDNIENVDDVRRAALQQALARPEISELFGNVILAGCCTFTADGGWEVLHVEQLTRVGVPAEAGV